MIFSETSLAFKVIAGLVALIIVLLGGYYAYSKIADFSVMDKRLKEAQAKVEQLVLEDQKNRQEWYAKEEDYRKRINSVNANLTRLKKRNTELETELKKIRIDRANIVVPDDPNAICAEFIKLGYGSCRRIR